MKTIVVLMLAGAAAWAQSLEGIVDIHVHSAPDSMPRSIDADDLARLAKKRGIHALLLKNHYEPTASLAFMVRKAVRDIDVFGGIALNRAVGGLNPEAVERMAKVKGGYGRVVWMPTFDSENQVRSSGEKRPFVSISKDGKLLPETEAVLDMMARYKLVLATGHSTPAENLMLIKAAKDRGISRIVVTHAMLAPVKMSISQMKQAATMGAYVEFVSNALLGVTRSAEYRDYANAMRAVGISYSILSSDLGQEGNPLHPDGLQTVFQRLRAEGLSAAEIEQMTKLNPARLLGLP